jgi:hypothetical protein
MRQPAFHYCIATELPATLGLDNGHCIDGTAFNLSRSGVLLRTRAPYPPAKSGTLTLRTKDARPLQVPVTVAHSGNRLVGLMLGSLDDASSAEIERLLGVEAGQDHATSRADESLLPERPEAPRSLNP